MVNRIDRDYSRFRQIVKGVIRKDLRKYMSRGELIGKKGKDLVSIPVPQIEIPHFRYGSRQVGGVGQGEGESGTPIAIDPEAAGGAGAGDQPGEHILEVDITIDELVEIMGEELELPRIQPKGKSRIKSEKDRYTGISRVGPESLRHFKRTFREALKRQIMSQTYDPKKPLVIPIKEDKRYKSWREIQKPETNAVVIYMMDVSGSMGNEQKEIVRIEAFWIDTWLQAHYKDLQTRYIIHDAVAREVDRHTFFHTRESGGTIISSAYRLAAKIVHEDYNPDDWNIYYFHFSDGDNWGEIDTEECLKILENELLPPANLFCYGQVDSPYGTGQFLQDLEAYFADEEKLITCEIPDKESIYDSIKTFLGKGR